MATEQGRPFLQCNVAEPKHNLSLKSFHYFVHCAAQCLISLLIYYFTKRFSVIIGLLDLSRTVLAECVGNSIRQPGSYVAVRTIAVLFPPTISYQSVVALRTHKYRKLLIFCRSLRLWKTCVSSSSWNNVRHSSHQ